MRLYPAKVDTHGLSPITMAFVGDGVYELMVREYLAAEANRPTGTLHKMAVSRVCAPAQAAAFEKIQLLLTEEELAIFKRGRNAHTARGGADYHRAKNNSVPAKALKCMIFNKIHKEFNYQYRNDKGGKHTDKQYRKLGRGEVKAEF